MTAKELQGFKFWLADALIRRGIHVQHQRDYWNTLEGEHEGERFRLIVQGTSAGFNVIFWLGESTKNRAFVHPSGRCKPSKPGEPAKFACRIVDELRANRSLGPFIEDTATKIVDAWDHLVPGGRPSGRRALP